MGGLAAAGEPEGLNAISRAESAISSGPPSSDILTHLGEDAMPVNPPDPIHTLRATDFQGLAE